MLSSDQPTAPDERGAPTGLPPTVPGHQLLRQIARGSYGEIWLARTELGAFRAVKIVHRKNFSDAKPFDREFAGIQRYEPFSREHEGLVDVLQVGRDEAAGFFYYVMELADDAGGPPLTPSLSPSDGERVSEGRVRGLPPARSPTFSPASYAPLTLAHAIRTRTRLPVSEVIELGISLARALEFLHARRLIHRDVKPQNIIFVGGQPKLADVGLVADLDGPQTLVGTDGYIPPEGPGTMQTDIFSLGKVLYEAATGKDRQEFPDLGMELDESPDRALLELNEVLLKACEGNPRARYSSAAAMAADLERIQAGQSLVQLRARRRRARAIAAGTAVIGGIALLAVGLAALVQHERSKPHLLFRDDFDGPQLDTNSWTWSQAAWLEVSKKGTPSFLLEQSGGELTLQAKAEQENDSISQAVWVDFRRDLRRELACRLEITLSGSTLGGCLAVSITSGNMPTNYPDLAGESLTICAALPGQSNTWSPRSLCVDLLPQRQAAIVYPDSSRLEDFEIMDLRALPVWRLRFYCSALSSKTFRSGESQIRVEKVAAWTRPSDERVLGRVVDDVSGSPVEGAIIKDRTGNLLARTLANGAFVLSRPPKGPLIVEKAGYVNSNDRPLYLGDQSLMTTVVLHKTNFVRGDMVQVISCGNLDVKDIAIRDSTIVLLAQDSATNFSLRSGDLDSLGGGSLDAVSRKTEFEPGFCVNSFAECGKRLIGINHWPGEIYDLDSTPPLRLLALTNQDGSPINWPNGCAFDGEFLWFLESDLTGKNHRLHALDLTSLKLIHSLRSGDQGMQGLAWREKQFWISSSEGRVYAVNRDAALRGRTAEAGLGPEFRGNYDRLTYGHKYLWGLQTDKRRICKIKLTD